MLDKLLSVLRKFCVESDMAYAVVDVFAVSYGKNHIFRKKVSGYRELVGIGISMKRYKEWHKKEVMKFSSLP